MDAVWLWLLVPAAYICGWFHAAWHSLTLEARGDRDDLTDLAESTGVLRSAPPVRLDGSHQLRGVRIEQAGGWR